MIIAFCGHSQIFCELDIIDKIMEILKTETEGETTVKFYLGHRGWFDNIAMTCCKKYKRLYNRYAKTCLVTLYETVEPNAKKFGDFDEIISPDLNRSTKSVVGLARNMWMIDQADLVIAYVNDRGGAQKALDYAIENNKRVINLGSYSSKLS